MIARVSHTTAEANAAARVHEDCDAAAQAARRALDAARRRFGIPTKEAP